MRTFVMSMRGVCFLSLALMGCATGQLTPGPDVSSLPHLPGRPTVVVTKVVDHRADPKRLGWAKSLECTLQGDALGRAEREIMKALHAKGFNVASDGNPTVPLSHVSLSVSLERLHVEYFGSMSFMSSPLFESAPRSFRGSVMLQGALRDLSGKVLWRKLIYYHTEFGPLVSTLSNQYVMDVAGDVIQGGAVKLANDLSLQEAIRSR